MRDAPLLQGELGLANKGGAACPRHLGARHHREATERSIEPWAQTDRSRGEHERKWNASRQRKPRQPHLGSQRDGEPISSWWECPSRKVGRVFLSQLPFRSHLQFVTSLAAPRRAAFQVQRAERGR
jgi:hypothetical protein